LNKCSGIFSPTFFNALGWMRAGTTFSAKKFLLQKLPDFISNNDGGLTLGS